MRMAVLALIALAGMSAGADAVETPTKFALHREPKALPEVGFVTDDGTARTLADFRGKLVLLNIWATWCVPCRHEMPTLDRLQAALGGPAFDVVALSIDRAGIEPVRRFYAEIGIAHLASYLDRSGKTARSLAVVGLPTTLLIDAEGREAGRLVGPAEWDAPEMIVFLRSRLPGKSSATEPDTSTAPQDQAAIATRRHDEDRDAELDRSIATGSDDPATKEGVSS